jgi:uncharacterized integral membrane protein
MGEDYDDYLEQSSTANRRAAALIMTGIIIATAIVFLLQNTEEATVKFLFLSGQVPIYVVILISMVLGALLVLIGFGLRRRAKRHRQHED